jgi:nucleoside-diphosphate-sugar epimerase
MASSPKPKPAPVLLTGASGQVGIHVLSGLLGSGFEVLAPSRRVKSSQDLDHPSGSKVTWINPLELHLDAGASASTPATLLERQELRGIETLVSSGPIRLALQCLDVFPEIKRVICLSTSSIITKAESPDPSERRQIQQIAEDERAVQETCTARNISLVVLQPTLIYGCGMDENISRMARFIQRFGFLPLAAPAGGLRQPVHASDLAALMVQWVESGFDQYLNTAVIGGSTITYRDMVEKVFQALGRKPRILFLPPRLFAACLGLTRHFPGLKGLNPAMILRQNQDLVFDDSNLRQIFDFSPRAFEPVLADFQLPEDLRALMPPRNQA